MKYILYFKEHTGEVWQQVVTAEPVREEYLQAGDAVLVLPEPVELPGYVSNGVYFTLPTTPSPHHCFNYTTKQWEDPRTLSDFKFIKETEIKRIRDAQEFAPFTYNGMTFDGDADAQRRLSGVVSAAKSAIAAGQTFTKEFTLADNSVVQLTAEDFTGIEMAKIWQVDVAFQEYRLKRAAIEAATTLEELEAIPV